MQNHSFEFQTKRLTISNWNQLFNHLSDNIEKILTKEVTKALPDDWQNLNSKQKIEDWIQIREQEGICLSIQNQTTLDIIGFMFIYIDDESKTIRLGYLLGQNYWGNKYASELIDGLCNYCKEQYLGYSLMGGVEQDNIASIKVLQKNGFKQQGEAHNHTLFFELKL